MDTDIDSSNYNVQNLWKKINKNYQIHVTKSTTKSEEINEKVVYIDDLEKRKEAYGICGECNEPGTGWYWCQPCNAKRFKENFKNWTSGNKDIDELIQHSQLNALCNKKCLEWVPFENFENVTYITKGGFGKIYSADWPEGHIHSWDIINQKWKKNKTKVALKSLDDSSNISTDFLNEIKSHITRNFILIVPCFGITQDPYTKDYMMVLQYCEDGNLRNCSSKYTKNKIGNLERIANGLLNIHNAEKVHKDFHSGNILCHNNIVLISDLGMCQPVNQSAEKGVYGVIPYMAPEVLRGCQYTKAADIYSFGIIINEYMSEEIPYSDIPHDYTLAVKICKGFRPKIAEDTPKLVADLIIKCWDAKAENRPTSKEIYQLIKKWKDEMQDKNSEIYSQIKEYEKNKRKKSLDILNNNISKNLQTHPQAIYTSRLLNFSNLSEVANSDIPSISSNPISECFDCELDQLDLNDLNQDDN
ncbi:kinase-like domain-containing protein [Glomus cerebriforme]|uniref:Kinase-like domain-containing protein n=1 Tax=Glomus cerebriforme TaxID=658196 RepID=A0A397T6J0_9GLOM|nr:kinase-like domain-containing protein [Glomus cerebriforme]